MNKVLCFGELLLRFSPNINADWLTKNSMPVYIGGSEFNVAAALSKWNIPVKYCTALPKNYLSENILNNLKRRGIDTSSIIFSGNKIGLYYLQEGTDLKHANVVYDRAYSSFSELKPEIINWNDALKDVCWLHFSAISAAINEQTAEVCKEAVNAAREKNITISVDLNYRSKLWQYKKYPFEIMTELISNCDVVMGNIWSANKLLKISLDEEIDRNKNKSSYIDHAYKTAKEIQQKFPACKTIANTFRFDREKNGIEYYATLFSNEKQFVSKKFSCDKIVGKVGSGDCFMAALIYGMINKHPPQQIVDFAAAAAFGKLQEKSDATNQSIEQINLILKNYE
ncbi:MAG: PfkB family carbohydrate kinase [Chitinophagaceae bacterium]